MNKSLRSGIALVISALGVGACSTLGEGNVTARYIGLVSIRNDQPISNVRRTDITALGMWIDVSGSPHGNGGGVGWRSAHLTSFPRDCRIMIVVKTDTQLKNAESFVSSLATGKDICASKSS
jgi:hypothetical protein